MTAQQIAFDLPPARATPPVPPPPFLALTRSHKGQSLTEVLRIGQDAYRARWGIEATVAVVSHADLGELMTVRTIQIRPASYVCAGVLYVGVEGS